MCDNSGRFKKSENRIDINGKRVLINGTDMKNVENAYNHKET
jgi:hypothetical protein